MKSNADDDSLPASHNRVMFTTVEALNTHLATRSYVTGYSLSEDDKAALAALKASPSSSAQPHAYRWALHISALTGKSVAQASAPTTSVSASVSTGDISSPRAISRATLTDVINSNSVFSGDDDVDEDEDDDEDTDFEKLPPFRKRLHSMFAISSSSFKNLALTPGRQAVTRKSSFIWQNNPVYSLSVTVADTKVRNTIYSISLSSLSLAAGPILNEDNDNQNIVYSSPSKPKLQSSSSTSTSTSTSSLSIECPVITAKANICSPKRVPILTYSDLTVYNPIYFSSLTSAKAMAYNSNDSSPLASARVMVYRQ